MSDGISEGYSMSEDKSSYTQFLWVVADYLKEQTEQNRGKVLKERKYFGRYYGDWPKSGEDLELQLTRLSERDEGEWADLLASCIKEDVGADLEEALKGLSPFSGKKIVILESQPLQRKMFLHGDYHHVLVEGQRIQGRFSKKKLLIV